MIDCNYGFIIICSGARSAQGIVDTAMQKLKSLVNERLTGKSGGGGGGGSGGGGKKGVSGSFLLFKCIIVTFWSVYYNFWFCVICKPGFSCSLESFIRLSTLL